MYLINGFLASDDIDAAISWQDMRFYRWEMDSLEQFYWKRVSPKQYQ